MMPSQALFILRAHLQSELSVGDGAVRIVTSQFGARDKDYNTLKPTLIAICATKLPFHEDHDDIVAARFAAVCISKYGDEEGNADRTKHIAAMDLAAQVGQLIQACPWRKYFYEAPERMSIEPVGSELLTDKGYGAWAVTWTQSFEFGEPSASVGLYLKSITTTFAYGPDTDTPRPSVTYVATPVATPPESSP